MGAITDEHERTAGRNQIFRAKNQMSGLIKSTESTIEAIKNNLLCGFEATKASHEGLRATLVSYRDDPLFQGVAAQAEINAIIDTGDVRFAAIEATITSDIYNPIHGIT